MKLISQVLIGLLFIIFLLLEGSVTTLPLVFVLLLGLAVAGQGEAVFVLAAISGILLDILTLRPVGETAIFYIVFLFLVILYDRKYEIHSLPFMVAAASIGSFVYLLFFVRQDMLLQTIISSLLGIIIFLLFRLSRKNNESYSYR